jgi:dihydrofolate reductase
MLGKYSDKSDWNKEVIMSEVIVYIAASLDGYIARKDDDVSWLDSYQVACEDYGYSDFMKAIGTVIMGARTYDESIKHPERMFTGVKTYVLSDKTLPVPSGASVEFYNGNLKTLIDGIKNEDNRDIFVVGGGRAVCSFLNEGLVDELVHFVVPILLKEGIPLYSALSKEFRLKLVETTSYKTGIVKLHYVRESNAP